MRFDTINNNGVYLHLQCPTEMNSPQKEEFETFCLAMLPDLYGYETFPSAKVNSLYNTWPAL